MRFSKKQLFDLGIKRENSLKRQTELKFGLEKRVINLEELFQYDKLKSLGLELDVSIEYTTQDLEDPVKLQDLNSIHSHRFGLRSSDSAYAQSQRFTCECGKLAGPTTGILCPNCETYTEDRFAIRGWFILKKYKVWNPEFFTLLFNNLKQGVSAKQLENDLLSLVKNPEYAKTNTIKLQSKTELINFIRKFVRPNLVETFIANIDKALTSKVPVINRNYRYHMVTKKLTGETKVDTHPLNKEYISISRNIHKLNEMDESVSEMAILAALNSINKHFMNINSIIKDIMGKDKESEIRGRVGGRRIGNSARNVVEGSLALKMDEAILSFRIFGELTIDEHRDLYERFGMTPESEFRMKNNVPRTSDNIIMIQVLNELKKRGTNMVMIYRAPTMYRSSIVSCQIKGLTRDGVVKINEITLGECLKGDKDL